MQIRQVYCRPCRGPLCPCEGRGWYHSLIDLEAFFKERVKDIAEPGSTIMRLKKDAEDWRLIR